MAETKLDGTDHAVGGKVWKVAAKGCSAKDTGMTTTEAWQMQTQSVQEQAATSRQSSCSHRQMTSGSSRQSTSSAPHIRHNPS